MARKPKDDQKPGDELLVEGEDALALTDPVEDEPIVDEDEEDQPGLQATPANPLEGMVPIERFNEVNAELTRTRQLMEQIAARIPSTPTPAQPAGPQWVNPTAPKDVQTWQGFVGETAGPQLTALEQRIQAQIAQATLQVSEANDERDMKQKFRDYDTYKADIDALRLNFYNQTRVAVPRDYVYRIVKSLREEQTAAAGRRSTVVKRGVAAGATPAKAPASGARPTPIANLRSKADVANLSFADLEKAALGLPV